MFGIKKTKPKRLNEDPLPDIIFYRPEKHSGQYKSRTAEKGPAGEKTPRKGG